MSIVIEMNATGKAYFIASNRWTWLNGSSEVLDPAWARPMVPDPEWEHPTTRDPAWVWPLVPSPGWARPMIADPEWDGVGEQPLVPDASAVRPLVEDPNAEVPMVPEPGAEAPLVPDLSAVHPTVVVQHADDPLGVLLSKLGLTLAEVTVHNSPAAYESTAAGVASAASKLAVEEEARRATSALDRVRSRLPELANNNTMATIWALWPAIDKSQLPAPLREAVREWAEERGYGDTS